MFKFIRKLCKNICSTFVIFRFIIKRFYETFSFIYEIFFVVLSHSLKGFIIVYKLNLKFLRFNYIIKTI